MTDDAYQAAIQLHAQGQHAEAEQALSSILAEEPGHLDASLALAFMRSRRGDSPGAIGVTQSAIALHPDSARAQCCLGELLRIARRPEEAAKACEAALRLQPDFAEAHNNLGLSLH
ncbi:MAG TPA: tetratricopeptide repeat protein, partial [Chloroflexota bacterium]|nr:tetratricopeptide repeat protein [Chloroflexota bacterium]